MDPRIILKAPGRPEQTVEHPGQPADYLHTDGTLWTWLQRWRVVDGVPRGPGMITGGVHIRVYDPVSPV